MTGNVQKLASKSIQVLRKFYCKNSAVSFSGGKDSLVALDLAFRVGINRAVFCNTGIEFPETIDYIKKVGNFYGTKLKLDTVRPTSSFFNLARILGFPSRRMRWCCESLKFGPLGRYSYENDIPIFITGLKKSESRKRGFYQYVSKNPFLPIIQLNPLLDWRDEDVWEYIDEYSLPANPLYKKGLKRIGCWPCPFKTTNDWKKTKELHPELIEILKREMKKVMSVYDVGIRNVDDFVDSFSWTKHAIPQSSEIVGTVINSGDGVWEIRLKKKEHLQRVLRLMPIIARDYKFKSDAIVIKNKNCEKSSIKTLVEKAINCIGCGACLSICKSLSLIDNWISIDERSCISCGECLKSRPRRACVKRNYAPLRFEVTVKHINSEFEESFEFEEEKMEIKGCSSHNSIRRVGLIRTRISLEKVLDSLVGTGKLINIGSTVFLKNRGFIASIAEVKGYTEVKIFATELEDAMREIRCSLKIE